MPGSSINSWDSWFIFNLRKINTCYYTNIHCTYIHGEGFKSHTLAGYWIIIWLFASRMLVNWQRNNNDGICYHFLLETCTLFEQCTYLGYLLLEAPREYVQHGPLVSINWLRLCPQFGARVRSHAVWRRLFIVLMTAAHISPNVFSLQNFLSNIRVLFLAYIYRHSYLLYITFNNIYILLLRDNHSVTSSIPLGRPTALGLLCPIQLPVVNGRGHLNML